MHLVQGSEARQSLSQIWFCWAGALGSLFSGLVYHVLLQKWHLEPFQSLSIKEEILLLCTVPAGRVLQL